MGRTPDAGAEGSDMCVEMLANEDQFEVDDPDTTSKLEANADGHDSLRYLAYPETTLFHGKVG